MMTDALSFTKHAQGPQTQTQTISVGRRKSTSTNGNGLGRRQSYASWISSLAAPPSGEGSKEAGGGPPPVPVPFEVQSPASTLRTIKLTQAPAPHAVHNSQPHPHSHSIARKLSIAEAEMEAARSRSVGSDDSHSRSLSHSLSHTGSLRQSAPPTAWAPEKLDGSLTLGKAMSTVEEVSENASSGTPRSPLRGKARSLVGGFVSGLRGIPRAMTHSQLYDRVSISSLREAHAAGEAAAGEVGGVGGQQQQQQQVAYPAAGVGVAHHQPHPQYTIPVYFAPPYAPPHPHAHAHGPPVSFRVQSPLSLTGSVVPGSEKPITVGSAFASSEAGSRFRSPSAYASEPASTSFAGSRRGISTFIDELSSLPWISPRVSVDYVPGTTGRARVKRSTSWYSVQAPPSPSEISQPWGKLPDPWFPPARLSPAVEVDEREEGRVARTREAVLGVPLVDGEEKPRIEEGEGEENFKGADEKEREKDPEEVDRLKYELQNRTQALQDLRQIVEHQKMAISALESQMEEMRRTNEETLNRRRSSVRHSLRARESVRVSRMSTIRRTSLSMRLSKTASSVME